MRSTTQTVRLKVSPEVARVAGKGAPREAQLQAARGALPLSPGELVTALFFLRHGADAQVRAEALKTIQGLDPVLMAAVAGDAGLHPRLLDFIARARLRDPKVMEVLLANPALPEATLEQVAAHAQGPILGLLAGMEERLKEVPAVTAALRSNPHSGPEVLALLDRLRPAGEKRPEGEDEGEEASESEEPETADDERNLSKYQRALEMGVSAKIKMATTGDKEWRGIFLKDSNKLVSAAVLKNPRITDGEVLMLAKNKSTNEELIRLVTMNREWIKNSEIQKALIYHPKTPLPKALRYMNILNEKDLKHLAKSRGVSQVLVNNARRMLTAKQKSK